MFYRSGILIPYGNRRYQNSELVYHQELQLEYYLYQETFPFLPSQTPSPPTISLQFGLPEMTSQRKMNQRGVIVLKQFSRVSWWKMPEHKSLRNSAAIPPRTRRKFRIRVLLPLWLWWKNRDQNWAKGLDRAVILTWTSPSSRDKW